MTSGTTLGGRSQNQLERLPREFQISRNVTLPVARYDWNEAGVTLRTVNGRKLSGRLGFTVGDFYSGTKRSVQVQGEFRPSENLSLNPTYSINDVNLESSPFLVETLYGS